MQPARSDERRMDDEAFLDLVHAHQTHVWRYLRYLGCDAASADDLTQDAFLAVYRGGFVWQGAAQARIYLRRTARSLFLKDRRGTARRRVFEDLDAADAAWERLTTGDDGDLYRAHLDTCLQQLGDRARRALAAVYGEGRSRKATAALLGMKDQGVKTLLRRTLQLLAACVRRRLTS